jgi:hypothetical protein
VGGVRVGVSQPAAVDGAPVEVGGLEAGGEEAVEGDGENLGAVVFVVVLVAVPAFAAAVGRPDGSRLPEVPADHRRVYNAHMSAARPNAPIVPKVGPSAAKRPDLVRGLPGTDRERAEQRRRFAEEHRETLRRLGK